MREISEALSDGGVDHLFLKGPLFSHRFYGELDLRTVGDIDILVHSEAFAAAEEVLRVGGFESNSRTLGGRALSRFFTHHFTYLRGRWAVELHLLMAARKRIPLAASAVSGME